MLTSRMASGQLKVATPFKSSCGSARLPQAALKGRCHTIKCLAVQDAVPLAARGDAHSTGRLESSKDEVRPPSRRWMIGSAMASMAFLSCPCCTGVAKASEGGPAGWSYETNVSVTGPSTWRGTCLVGEKQSPINLPDMAKGSKKTPGFQELVFKYQAGVDKAFVSNPGHGSMQVNFPPGSQMCNMNGQMYDLLQYHFHTPSEHALDGKRFSMEVHLVHKNRDTGQLAVVGVLMDSTEFEKNPCLQIALENAPKPGVNVPLESSKALDPTLLLPTARRGGDSEIRSRGYVHYPGSLTTPPCSEVVDWFVMSDPISISDHQVIEFMKFSGGGNTLGLNSRPLQPLQGRELDYNL